MQCACFGDSYFSFIIQFKLLILHLYLFVHFYYISRAFFFFFSFSFIATDGLWFVMTDNSITDIQNTKQRYIRLYIVTSSRIRFDYWQIVFDEFHWYRDSRRNLQWHPNTTNIHKKCYWINSCAEKQINIYVRLPNMKNDFSLFHLDKSIFWSVEVYT